MNPNAHEEVTNNQDGEARGGGGGFGARRGGGRGGGRGGRGGRGPGGRMGMNHEDRVLEKLQNMQGPTLDLPPKEVTGPKKFTNHCRLFVGNIPNDMKQEEFEEIFKKFGEIAEVFVNRDKAFGFVKMDFRANAEKAKSELDGTVFRGRTLKIRYAQHGSALKVSNLSPYISNELLEKCFSVFGEVEHCVVIADSKGKSTGEGIVEFCTKPSAMLALKMCTEGCFFLTSTLRPVVVTPFEEDDNKEGFSEKMISKRNPDYSKEREIGPRFAAPGSFEFEYGTSWKGLFDLKKQKIEAVESEMKYEMEKLEEQMEYAKFEHETNKLREQLRQREMARERQLRDSEHRLRQREEARQREQAMYRNMAEEMQTNIQRREEMLKRRAQENMMYNMEGEFEGAAVQYGNGENMKRALASDTKPAMETYQAGEGTPANFGAFDGQFAGEGGNWGRRNNEEFVQNKRRKWQ